jgi:hypothetical protein
MTKLLEEAFAKLKSLRGEEQDRAGGSCCTSPKARRNLRSRKNRLPQPAIPEQSRF